VLDHRHYKEVEGINGRTVVWANPMGVVVPNTPGVMFTLVSAQVGGFSTTPRVTGSTETAPASMSVSIVISY